MVEQENRKWAYRNRERRKERKLGGGPEENPQVLACTGDPEGFRVFRAKAFRPWG